MANTITHPLNLPHLLKLTSPAMTPGLPGSTFPPVPNHVHASFQKVNFSEESYRLTITTSLTSCTPASVFQLPQSSSHLHLLPKIGHQRPPSHCGLAQCCLPLSQTLYSIHGQ